MAEEKAIQFGEEFDTGTSRFVLLDEGKYEFKIVKIEDKVASNSNKPYKRFFLEVRDVNTELNKKFKGKWITFNISKRDNDPTYDFNKVNKLILSQKNTKDYKTRFIEPDEIWLYLTGRCLTAEVENEYNEYLGKDVSQIKDYSWGPSAVEETEDAVSPATTSSKKTVDPSDLQDALPWE